MKDLANKLAQLEKKMSSGDYAAFIKNDETYKGRF